MRAVPLLADLEKRLADARTHGSGTSAELTALVEYAARLVPEPLRRGELAREGVALATRLGDEVARVRCQAMAGESLARQGQPTEALSDALQTLSEAERIGHPLAIAQSHHTVAHCFDALDCVAEAFEHVYRALENYQRGGDTFGEARMLSFIASLLAQVGDRSEAVGYYAKAYETFRHIDLSGAGTMLACIGLVRTRMGEPAAAVESCERALEHFEEVGMPLDVVIAMEAYTLALTKLDQLDMAELWAKRGLERNRRPDGTPANYNYEIDLQNALAGVQLARRDLDAARTTLERVIDLADSQLALSSGARAEGMLAEVLHAAGDPAGAYEHLLRGRQLANEVNEAVYDRRVRALRVRFEVEQAQREAIRYREEAQAQAGVIAELERTKAELAARMADLERLNAEVVQLSRTDPLTGIANRRFVNERLAEFSARTARHRTPLVVAVFDVDRFKGINDRFGHGVGDVVLTTLTGLLRGHLRMTDLPARLGGDEFVILMPGTRADQAAIACRRLQAAVREYNWSAVATGLVVTITIGLADGTGNGDPDEILRLADDALYRGKRGGRDTVTV